MPIEVREVVIKAVVDDQTKTKELPKKSSNKDQSEIVEDCVEQVLEIMKRENER